MHLRQRRMLTVVAIAIGVLILWPPVNMRVGPDATELEYVWLFSDFDGSVDVLLLIAECLSLGLIGIISHRVLGKEA